MAVDPSLPDYGDRAKAIGTVILIERQLEAQVENLILRLCGGAIGQLQVVLSIVDFRDKITILKVFAFQHLLSNKRLFERLESLLNEIDGTIRNGRNRLIHDQHAGQGDQAVLHNPNPKFAREKSTGRITLDIGRVTKMSDDNIKEIVMSMYRAGGGLAALENEIISEITRNGLAPFGRIFP